MTLFILMLLSNQKSGNDFREREKGWIHLEDKLEENALT